jgi:hypothetical protein
MSYAKGAQRGAVRPLSCSKCGNNNPEEMDRLHTVGDLRTGRAQLRCNRCEHIWWSRHQDRLIVPW